jgi:serine/threonine-protein phosphatase 6 regulatory ankyrin repeat subunit B
LRGGLHWLALGFLLLAVTFLAVKFAVPLMHHDHKKAAQEQERKLFRAIGKGDQEMVRRLLLTGVNPDAVLQGKTLLEIALKMNEIEIAEILYESGASLSIRGRNVNGLFLQEINRDNTKGAHFLLRHGADANAAFYGDYSALCSAAAHGNTELMQVLLEHGANVNFVGERGNTPLISAASAQRLEAMKLLLARGVNVSPRNAAGYTPLRIAKENRNGEMVTLLTNAGAIE